MRDAQVPLQRGVTRAEPSPGDRELQHPGRVCTSPLSARQRKSVAGFAASAVGCGCKQE